MDYIPKEQTVEVTTAVHENDHILRRLINKDGGVFDVKGITKNKQTKNYVSQPYVYTDYEAQEDLANKILERIREKNNKYPEGTILIIQCFLDTLFIEDEWECAIQKVKEKVVAHSFFEIFVFDSNHHYSATIYGDRGSMKNKHNQ